MVKVQTGSCCVGLSTGNYRELSREFKAIAKQIADEYVPEKFSSAGNLFCQVAIYEFLKNLLHGEDQTVEIEKHEGYCVLTADDVTSKDHLNPEWCGNLGNTFITGAMGEENYSQELVGCHYKSQPVIDPERIAKNAAAA